MLKKLITQRFPFLLTLRKKQRKCCYYLKMYFDHNKYAKEKSEEQLPIKVYEAYSPLINPDSGYDLQYQYNKIHNLKLAADHVSQIIIRPNETFSFWQLIKKADKKEPYKDGLNLVNGKIVGTYGGGLCQLSNLLFWLFLHSPLTVIERHSHTVKAFPSPPGELPEGTDATISEGWLDLKVKNETLYNYQILISFDEEKMYGCILSDKKSAYYYEIFNQDIYYYKENGKVFQQLSVFRNIVNRNTNKQVKHFLYDNKCQIGYELPADELIYEKGELL